MMELPRPYQRIPHADTDGLVAVVDRREALSSELVREDRERPFECVELTLSRADESPSGDCSVHYLKSTPYVRFGQPVYYTVRIPVDRL